MNEIQKQLVSDYNTAMEQFKKQLEMLNNTIHMSKEHLEGNLFYRDHDHWEPFVMIDDFAEKRYNLFHLARTATNIMEIGFNGGHSCFLSLIANPTSKIQLFDMGNHGYSRLCFHYLNRVFPNRLSLIVGDSTVNMPLYNTATKFDLIHIDGGHGKDVITADILNSKKFAANDAIVIVDDYEVAPITEVTDAFLSSGFLNRLDVPFNETRSHIVTRYHS
jgi:hypothetical protein